MPEGATEERPAEAADQLRFRSRDHRSEGRWEVAADGRLQQHHRFLVGLARVLREGGLDLTDLLPAGLAVPQACPYGDAPAHLARLDGSAALDKLLQEVAHVA